VTDSPEVYDLSARREARAARSEMKRKPLVLRFSPDFPDVVLATEFPLDILAPLRRIDTDLALMVRQAVTAARGTDADARWNATELVIDLLAANPALPVTTIEVIVEIAKNLLGEEGFKSLLAARPTGPDCADIAKRVFAHYGVGLGESSSSSDSSTNDSGTSKPTSLTTTTDSTPVVSSSTPESPGSSASGGSSA